MKLQIAATRLGERQRIAQKGVHAIDARNFAARNGSSAVKTQCSRSRAVNAMSVNTLLCDTLGLAEQEVQMTVRDRVVWWDRAG